MDILPHISGPQALFWGVITFSILVIIHEGGHFLAARAFGVKVHEFMIGLPGPALRFRSKKSGVYYGVTAFPLGGYVRIAGMEPGSEDERLAAALKATALAGTVDASTLGATLQIPRDDAAELLVTLEDYGTVERDKDGHGYTSLVKAEESDSAEVLLDAARKLTYRGQPFWKRVTILAMGVLLNLLTAILIFTTTLTIWGYPVASTSAVVGSVMTGSAAQKAGVVLGDRIVSVGGKPVKDWPTVMSTIASFKPKAVEPVVVVRKGQRLTLVTTFSDRSGHAFFGIGPATVQKRFTVLSALRESFIWTGLVFVAIARFFSPATFASSLQDARSVVGISYEVASAVQRGPVDYAWMVALLSLSLGVMNILPIPPLDGGKVAVEIVERIRRRPLPREVSLALSAVGAVLLFSLIFYLMYADIMRYIVRG
jgi:regulator of sigma E protease